MGQYTATIDDRLVLPARALLTLGQERRLQRAGESVPAGVSVRLVIDTGSGRSTLSPSVLTRLDPVPQGPVRIETGAGTKETMLFWIRLEFPGHVLDPVPHLAVARLALPRSLQDYLGLIGRDLLFRWESFLLEGRRRRLSIRDTPRIWLGWLRG